MGLFDFSFPVSLDFWFNADRISRAEAISYVNGHRWWRIRAGYWACSDAIVQLEIVPGAENGIVSALAWIIEV